MRLMFSVYLAHYLAIPPQSFGFVGVRRCIHSTKSSIAMRWRAAGDSYEVARAAVG
jgi:hypothetical protein